MSIQKQQRILSYKPTIIVATPGRLWELISDYMDPYLMKNLPLIDVFVLDEADRMIADGHFKEMREIIAHIYTERVKIKN
jgi:ATP-dependent RNA helicase DDX24/MAK5